MYDFARIEQHFNGGPNTESFPIAPWADFDPRCEAHVVGGWVGDPDSVAGGFFFITPLNGDASRQNVGRFETERALLEDEFSRKNLTARARFRLTFRRHVLSSFLAQLRGEPGAIPPAAGNEYREWIQWLRAHDPSQGGDPRYVVGPDEVARTLAAVIREKERIDRADKAHYERLEASGRYRRYRPGRENDPSRLP